MLVVETVLKKYTCCNIVSGHLFHMIAPYYIERDVEVGGRKDHQSFNEI